MEFGDTKFTPDRAHFTEILYLYRPCSKVNVGTIVIVGTRRPTMYLYMSTKIASKSHVAEFYHIPGQYHMLNCLAKFWDIGLIFSGLNTCIWFNGCDICDKNLYKCEYDYKNKITENALSFIFKIVLFHIRLRLRNVVMIRDSIKWYCLPIHKSRVVDNFL